MPLSSGLQSKSPRGAAVVPWQQYMHNDEVSRTSVTTNIINSNLQEMDATTNLSSNNKQIKYILFLDKITMRRFMKKTIN